MCNIIHFGQFNTHKDMSLSTFLSNPAVAGASALAGSLFQGINGIMSGVNTKKMIEAQKQMNQANIASQERINQQNIDFQQGINDLMRHDANNAISIKKQDMINAGYSTADPNMQGNSIAQLGSPQLQAPQVESEFNSDMANYQQNAFGSFAQSLLDNANVLTDIQLKKAQSREHNRNADFRERELAWYDVNQAVAYKGALVNIYQGVTAGDYNKVAADEKVQAIENLKGQFKLLHEQIISAKIENKFKPKKLKLEVESMQQSLNNLKATYQEILSSIRLNSEKVNTEKSAQSLNYSGARLNDAKKDTEVSLKNLNISKEQQIKIENGIKEFEKRNSAVKYSFAKYGINYDSSNYFDVAAKYWKMLLDGGNVEVDMLNNLNELNYIQESLGNIISDVPEEMTRNYW